MKRFTLPNVAKFARHVASSEKKHRATADRQVSAAPNRSTTNNGGVTTLEMWRESMFSTLDNRQYGYKMSQLLTAQIQFPSSSANHVGEVAAAVSEITRAAKEGTSAAEVVSAIKTITSRSSSDLLASPRFVSSAMHGLLTCLRFDDGPRSVGDLPFFYAGRALKKGIMNDELWSDVMCAVALLGVSQKMFDLWQEQLFQFYGVPLNTVMGCENSTGQPLADTDADVEGDDALAAGGEDFDVVGSETQQTERHVKPLIPFKAMNAMLSWASHAKDMERAMKLYHVSKTHGVAGLVHNGALDPALLCRLAVKVIASARNNSFDGGIKERMVKEVRSLVPSETLLGNTDWGVLNDLIAGLSFSAALTLVKLASQHRGGDESVPFFIWVGLLRKAAMKRCVAEAEQLFLFIRKRYRTSSEEKGELVEVMMRMHASQRPPDFTSALSIFIDHVASSPEGEPTVAASPVHYKLLIQAADSRNAAAMIFLEGCAKGVPHENSTFSSLFSQNPSSSMSSLSRKLPRDYSSSSLDSQLRIPADSDAHVRREEALRYRGKAPVDSTSEVR